VPFLFGDGGADDVSRSADGGSVAADVGAQRQRPGIGCRLKPAVRERFWITGTMVAAKGMLSTMAEAKADIQRISGITSTRLPPETVPI
jgi:hypothetical protein